MNYKTIYIAHAVTTVSQNNNLIDMLVTWLEDKDYEIIRPKARAKPGTWGFEAIKALDISDILIADVSDPSHGVGFEIGYHYAKSKKVILVAKQTVRKGVSRFLLSLFPGIIFYSEFNNMKADISKHLDPDDL